MTEPNKTDWLGGGAQAASLLLNFLPFLIPGIGTAGALGMGFGRQLLMSLAGRGIGRLATGKALGSIAGLAAKTAGKAAAKGAMQTVAKPGMLTRAATKGVLGLNKLGQVAIDPTRPIRGELAGQALMAAPALAADQALKGIGIGGGRAAQAPAMPQLTREQALAMQRMMALRAAEQREQAQLTPQEIASMMRVIQGSQMNRSLF